MRTAAWIADYPDGDNFMQLMYGKNIHQSNNACAAIPEYDKLYEQSMRMPDSPERDRLYHEMAKIIETLRAVATRHQPLPEHAGAASRAGVQEAPDPARRVAVHRRERPTPK